MKLANLIGSALLIFSSTAMADPTSDFRDYFEGNFIGSESEAQRTWDMTSCTTRVLGRCVARSGFEIFGEASGRVDSLNSYNGPGVLLTPRSGGWDGETWIEAWVDVKYDFRYTGQTSGKKQCHPGNFNCGWEWGSLHPEGKIKIEILSKPGTNFEVHAWYEVLGGHDDKPNTLVKDAMKNLSGKVVSILQRWVISNGVKARVVLK